MFYLHGFMGSAEDFDFFPESFQDLSYLDVPLIISMTKQWDMLGHHLWHQIDEQEPVPIFGYSMGGRMALAMLAVQPERVKKLVLCGAQFRPPVDHRLRRDIDCDRALFLEKDPDKFLETWSKLPLFGPQEAPAWNDLQKRRIEALKVSSKVWSYLLAIFSVSSQPDFSSLIETYSEKITFVYGENDKKYAGIANDYEALGVQKIAVPNAWHAVHLDNPEGLLSILKTFS